LAHKYAYAPDALGLLRARGERPRRSRTRTPEKRDELASPHSITWEHAHDPRLPLCDQQRVRNAPQPASKTERA